MRGSTVEGFGLRERSGGP